MGRTRAGGERLPRGVARLEIPRGDRGYRASIRHGKGVEVHLGLYETPWLAAFAHQVAARAIGRASAAEVEAPHGQQPTADQVRAITAKVRHRLGLDPPPTENAPPPPATPDDWLVFFEVTVVGFWRSQAAEGAFDGPEQALDVAAARLADAASLIFPPTGRGDRSPRAILTRLVGRRLDATFRRPELTRSVLDDDGDDDPRLARWLVYPETNPAGGHVGFRETVRRLYADVLGESPEVRGGPEWAAILGLMPPYTASRVRSAYLARCREAHPDAGGSDAAFVRLKAAYDEALARLG